MAERRKKPEEPKVEEVVSIETGNTEEKPEEKPAAPFDAEGWINKILDTLNNHEDRLKDVEQIAAAVPPQQQPSPQEQEGAVTFFEQVEFPTYGDQTPAEPTQDIPDYQPSYLR